MLKQILKQATRLFIVLALLFGLGVQVKPALAVDNRLKIIVNDAGDAPDATATGFVCETAVGNGVCTLRAAIMAANHAQSYINGTLITFNIPLGPSPSIAPTVINIGSALPGIDVAGTTIQGPNLAAGVLDNSAIVVDGNKGAYSGLVIRADNCAIKNLTISDFGGFNKYGIEVNGTLENPITGTLISGNKIGDLASFSINPQPNGGGIKLVNAGSSLIGGSTAAERNIISGNAGYGILVDAGGTNVIKGNFVGLNSDGSQALSNSTGILLDGSDGNTIGGNTSGERNIISGNTQFGVHIEGDNNVVTGNYIGTDTSGTIAIPNAAAGIRVAHNTLTYSDNRIGGDFPGEGNLISGNTDYGIFVSKNENITIQGNTIGLNIAQTTALPNKLGISIYNSNNTLIGGTTAGAGNTISSNIRMGIFLTKTDSGVETITSIKGNNISNNGLDGIMVQYATNVSIGGSSPLTRNTIANNGDNGLGLDNAYANIEGNSIFNNTALGIDAWRSVSQSGVTPNDVNEADDIQNFPGITNVSFPNAGQVLLQGQMTTTSQEQLTLYFYGNDACDPSGYGEGQVYLGLLQKSANASGQLSFSVELPNPEAKTNFTASAWGPTHGNSEFSPCRSAGIFPPIMFDVYLPAIMK